MTVMFTYTVYNHPSDYPDAVVVRRWAVRSGTLHPDDEGVWCLAKDLVAARQSIPDGLVCIPAQEGDDATIVETWL